MSPVEEWRPAVGYEGRYEVSSLGRIFSVDNGHPSTGRILKAKPNKRGYPRVCLTAADGSRRSVQLHILICETFHGPKPSGMEVLHRDGTRRNHATNLRWGTHAENMAEAAEHGVIRQPNAVLTDAEVLAARRLTMKQIREKHGVSKNYAYQLARGSAPRALRLQPSGRDTTRIPGCIRS